MVTGELNVLAESFPSHFKPKLGHSRLRAHLNHQIGKHVVGCCNVILPISPWNTKQQTFTVGSVVKLISQSWATQHLAVCYWPLKAGVEYPHLHTSKVSVQLDQHLQVGVVRLWSSSLRLLDVLLGDVIFTHGWCSRSWWGSWKLEFFSWWAKRWNVCSTNLEQFGGNVCFRAEPYSREKNLVVHV